jgi:phosphoribosylformylglycinamidine cyclo-ligase
VLVASTDGVGTKLKLAFATGRHSTVGIDLVAMSVNDVIVTGAEPLFFLDYYATSKLDADAAAEVVAGIAEGCAQSGCALLGGETAELPGFYAEGEYDLAGFAVGIVERSEIIDGSKVAAGDVVLGLASSGLHSNGFALVRRVLFDMAGLSLDARPAELGGSTLVDELLQPTIIYVRAVSALRRSVNVKALAHITGGGLPGNLPRVLPAGTHARIRTDAWQRPAIFDLLARLGEIELGDLFETFNMGIGMCAVVAPQDADAALAALAAVGQKAWNIGAIETGTKASEPEVFLTSSRSPVSARGE